MTNADVDYALTYRAGQKGKYTKRVLGVCACGANAEVSRSKDGVTNHYCLQHLHKQTEAERVAEILEMLGLI